LTYGVVFSFSSVCVPPVSLQSQAFKWKDLGKSIVDQVVTPAVTGNQQLPPTRVSHRATDPAVCEQQAVTNARNLAVTNCSTQTRAKCKVLSSSISRAATKEYANNGPFEVYDSGSDDNAAVAEQKAIANAERSAITECTRKTLQPCDKFSPGFVSQSASENPARSIGGLKTVPKYDARAGASAVPKVKNQDNYVCEATAIAQPSLY
jgi:hypothetical protein